MSSSQLKNSILFIVLVVPIYLLNFKVPLILSDPFHYGEYFASLTKYLSAESFDELPLTIHGALDFFPVYFIKNILLIENYFVYTKVLYHVLNFFSSAMLVLIAYNLLKFSELRFLILFSVALMAPMIVGYRDLFLLISVFLFLKTLETNQNIKKRIGLEVLFGIFVGLGVFWSFDRGIATTVSLGIAILYLIYKERTHIFSLLSFLLVVVYISILSDLFPIKYYYENVIFLMETSSNWSYGLTLSTTVLRLFALVLNILIVSIFAYNVFSTKPIISKEIALFIAFLLFSMFMLKMGLNRADNGHVAFTLVFPLLMIIMMVNEKNELNKKIQIFFLVFTAISFLLALKLLFYPFALIFALAIYALSIKIVNNKLLNTKHVFIGSIIMSSLFLLLVSYKNYTAGKYNWFELINKNISNIDYVEDSIKWVSSEIRNSNTKCVFDLSNHGIINGLTNLPSCTKFTYLVYADERHEEEIINKLELNSPSVIVYSSINWSYSIDNKPMKKRFKKLDLFIQEKYKYEVCKYGYCLRSLTKHGDFK